MNIIFLRFTVIRYTLLQSIVVFTLLLFFVDVFYFSSLFSLVFIDQIRFLLNKLYKILTFKLGFYISGE